MNAKLALIILSLLFSANALACISRMDCRPGSRCEKESGEMEGVCVGGPNPGNANDLAPMRDALDQNGTYGDTCSSDNECGHENSCYMEGGPRGVCMPRR